MNSHSASTASNQLFEWSKIPNNGYLFKILAVSTQFVQKTSKHYVRHISVIKINMYSTITILILLRNTYYACIKKFIKLINPWYFRCDVKRKFVTY